MNSKLKILMLTTKFYHPDGSLWLTSELGHTLSKLGHDISIINVEWSGIAAKNAKNENFELLNLVAYNIKIPILSVLIRWLLSSLKPLPFLVKAIIKNKKYDLLIAFSPCSALYATIPIAHLLSRKSSLLYWDFFPSHNQEISKKAPIILMPLLKYLEKKLVHSFDQVGCMSAANVRFYGKYFGLSSSQYVKVIPIWTSFTDVTSSNREIIRVQLGVDSSSVVVVFGGQLVPGRGILELCQAVVNAKKIDNRIVLLICGSGDLANKIELFENEYPETIRKLGFVDRVMYMDILSVSDIGVVSTVSGVSSPSYPSKSLDYMACSLPVLAAIEDVSDFGDIAEANNFGLSCPASNVSAMTESLLTLSTNQKLRYELGENGKKYLQTTHDISNIVNLIIDIVD